MIGSVIGNYRVLRQLGEGGMGAVYLAEHSLLRRQAAIKVLLPSLSAREDVINRFFNEARAATTIGDPGIVQVFDFGQHTDGSAYLVMELLDGEALDKRLARHHRLAPADALRITRQIAMTLGAAHGKGIIHRDLKPENVFLVRDQEVAGGERAKILDFGIAKLTGQTSLSKTQTGALMGTPIYMSPEQCRGAGDLDHRSDIYALGCVVYHLLTGRPPFVADGLGELLAMHMIVAPAAPSQLVPELPPELDALVLCCLAKKPEERFQTMGDVAAAIDALMAGPLAAAASAMSGGWRTPVPPPTGGAASWPPPASVPPLPGSWPGPPAVPA
ncbi:MAG TPA: serine/threonine-protein kinase, partial [Kofleriaceae bacterium]|nr:serine/threonine-protein kinase [Kofleriaceae bacterium]